MQSQVRLNPEKVPEKVPLVQSQVRFNRVSEKVPRRFREGSEKVREACREGSGEVRFSSVCFRACARFRKICTNRRCGCWRYHRSLFFGCFHLPGKFLENVSLLQSLLLHAFFGAFSAPLRLRCTAVIQQAASAGLTGPEHHRKLADFLGFARHEHYARYNVRSSARSNVETLKDKGGVATSRWLILHCCSSSPFTLGRFLHNVVRAVNKHGLLNHLRRRKHA